MLELHTFKNPGEPFPKSVEIFKDPDQLMLQLGFTHDDVSRLLNGELLREQYYIEFTAEWLDQIAEEAIDRYESKTNRDVSDTLGITECDVAKYLMRVKAKLEKTGNLKKFLLLVRELRTLRSKGKYEYYTTNQVET
jgi:hypothetical protein